MHLRWLPGLQCETSGPTAAATGCYSYATFQRNLGVLQGLRDAGNEEATYLLALADEYGGYMADITQYDRIEQNPGLPTDAPLISPQYPLGPEIMQIRIGRGLRELPAGEPLLCLTTSHGTTGPLIRACHTINPSMRIGVICVDAHADLYDGALPMWKGNVFTHLLAESSIAYLCVMGIPAFRREAMLNQVPGEIGAKSTLLTERVTPDDLTIVASRMLDAGVTHLYVSIDPDGFTTRASVFTAMEYCPFNCLVNLGQVDLTGVTPDTLSTTLDQVIRPANPHQGGKKNLYHIGDTGVTICQASTHIATLYEQLRDQATPYLDCGPHVYGDIVELFGPDVEGRTAYAVTRLAQHLDKVYGV